MNIKVLGSVSPYCKNDRNCAGYLIDTGKGKILLDCGFGASGNLCFPDDLRELSIIISHYHKDHYSDLFSIFYASLYHQNAGIRIDVYIPETEEEGIKGDFELIKANTEGIYTLHTYNDSSKLNICGFEVSFFKTFHAIECHSVCLEGEGKKLVYSADMGYHNVDAYCEFCKGAELFICESTFLSTDEYKTPFHLQAEQAAMIAKQAGVKQLMLTHTSPEKDKREYLNEARRVFDRVCAAEENTVFTL